MKLVGLLFLCVLPIACATTSVQTDAVAPQAAQPSPNTMRIQIGGRSLDESDWSPVEDQVSFAFEFVREPAEAPIGFEIGTQFGLGGKEVHVSGSGDVDVASIVSELYGGVHKTFFRDALIEPYVGGGLTLLYASFATDFGNSTTSDSDTTAGLYLRGGLQTHVAANLIIGIDLRAVFGTDINLFGTSGDADYGQAAVFLGVGF